MTGYQVTFFTNQDRRHKGKPLGDFLVRLAQEMDLRGATLVGAGEGFGHHRKVHSVRFFEQTNQPLEVIMALTADETDRLFERLQQEHVQVFYVKTPVEFGMLGTPPD